MGAGEEKTGLSNEEMGREQAGKDRTGAGEEETGLGSEEIGGREGGKSGGKERGIGRINAGREGGKSGGKERGIGRENAGREIMNGVLLFDLSRWGGPHRLAARSIAVTWWPTEERKVEG
ncbi:hypothetical protein ACLOJK_003016 [Asimina triloba]